MYCFAHLEFDALKCCALDSFSVQMAHGFVRNIMDLSSCNCKTGSNPACKVCFALQLKKWIQPTYISHVKEPFHIQPFFTLLHVMGIMGIYQCIHSAYTMLYISVHAQCVHAHIGYLFCAFV